VVFRDCLDGTEGRWKNTGPKRQLGRRLGALLAKHAGWERRAFPHMTKSREKTLIPFCRNIERSKEAAKKMIQKGNVVFQGQEMKQLWNKRAKESEHIKEKKT